MFSLFVALKALGVLRVSPEEEQAGLDLSEHGMHAYPPQWVVDTHGGFGTIQTPAAPAQSYQLPVGSAPVSSAPEPAT